MYIRYLISIQFMMLVSPRGSADGTDVVVGPNPRGNPSRELGRSGRHSSALFALALDEPRPSVVQRTATDPATILASQAGTRIGALAPTASARCGSHSETRAGSSSVML